MAVDYNRGKKAGGGEIKRCADSVCKEERNGAIGARILSSDFRKKSFTMVGHQHRLVRW